MSVKDTISMLLRALAIVAVMAVSLSLAISIRAQNGHSIPERMLLQEQRIQRQDQDLTAQSMDIVKLRDELMAQRNTITKLETAFYLASGILTLILGSQLVVQIKLKMPPPPKAE